MFLHCVNQYWQIKLFPAVFCNHSHKIYREKACWGPRGGGVGTTNQDKNWDVNWEKNNLNFTPPPPAFFPLLSPPPPPNNTRYHL